MAQRGRPKKILTQAQVGQIVADMRLGSGRMRACQTAGVNYRMLVKNMRDHEWVKEAILDEERGCVEDCMKNAFKMKDHAQPFAALSAIQFYVSRKDKAAATRRAMRAVSVTKGLVKGSRLAMLIPKLVDITIDLLDERHHDEFMRRMQALADESESVDDDEAK